MIHKGIVGLSHAGRTESGIRRFIWVVIFLGGLTATLHSITSVVEDFLSYPVETTVAFHTPPNVIKTYQRIYQVHKQSTDKLKIPTIFQIDFPSVTVCNQNRIDCSKLNSVISACADVTSASCPLLSDSSKTVVTNLMAYCPPGRKHWRFIILF